MKDKKILITGASGQLAKEFQRMLSEQELCFVAPAESKCDITNFTQTRKLITKEKPDVIINCAAYNAVDEAEEKSELAYMVNSGAVENLAKLCKENNIFFIHYSSDYVFDGNKQDLYVEDDTPNPLNVYGKSKLSGEQAVSKILSDFLIFRVSWVFGDGKQNFLYKLSDEVSVPTSTKDIVNVTLLSLEKGLKGLYHLPNSGYCSRYELAKYFIKKKGLSNLVIPVSASTFKTKVKRPLFSAMSNKKISKHLNIAIPHWKKAINRFIAKFTINPAKIKSEFDWKTKVNFEQGILKTVICYRQRLDWLEKKAKHLVSY